VEPNSVDLKGRVALVTGATAGLGRECARALHECGAEVVAVGRRKELLDTLAEDLPGCLTLQGDLSEPDEVEALASAARERFGLINILVNNAGFGGNGTRAERETRAEFDALFEVNLHAPFRLAQLVFPDMVERGGGSIVNVSSISAIRGIGKIPQAGYVASKHALTGLTRELALQWGRHNIRVNALAPGFFETEMTAPLFAHEKTAAWIESRTALPGRAVPANLVGALLFLVSDGGSWMTGQTLCVDGGWSAA
jgi:NAD(P)-dependent dehydrogenase (short-subunit alcohol dehydrogenase family)